MKSPYEMTSTELRRAHADAEDRMAYVLDSGIDSEIIEIESVLDEIEDAIVWRFLFGFPDDE